MFKRLPLGRFFICSDFMSIITTESFLPGVSNERIFSFANELVNAQRVINEHLAPQAVLKWLTNQVEFFLTEFGVGEPLVIQPSYFLKIIKAGGEVKVGLLDVDEYGNQAGSFENTDGFPEAIAKGLRRANEMLAEAKKGEGVVILSPTDFYQDFGSKYDVMNLFRVMEIGDDGSRVVEGRFLLLNGGLDSAERVFLLNWHNDQVNIPLEATPDLIVSSPQQFSYGEDVLEKSDPMIKHTEMLRLNFRQRFNKDLLKGEVDWSSYERVKRLVGGQIHLLRELLLVREESGFVNKLKSMMIESQRLWAETNWIDPDIHIAAIFTGQLQLGGIHPLTKESDPFANSDGVENSVKKCRKCQSEYLGSGCPHCG